MSKSKYLKIESGKKFNRLTTIDYSHTTRVIRKDRNTFEKYFYYNMICECGKETKQRIDQVVRGQIKSCGCVHKEYINSTEAKERIVKISKNRKFEIDNNHSAFMKVYHSYKFDQRKLEFNLSKEDVKSLTSKDCTYCGDPPKSISLSDNKMGEYVYNGIDRVDPNIGHILENCVTCCFICNRAKSNMGLKDFLEWIKKVHNNLNLNNESIN